MSCCLNVQRFSSPCGCGVTDQGGVSTPENLEERARAFKSLYYLGP